MRPDNPDIMYVTASPGGIFKSTDGGQSWFSVTIGIEPSPGYGADIFCATIDPHDYNTVWVGTQFIAHIYRSTNGGNTWEQRDNGIITHYEESVRGITIDPWDPNILYAGVEVALYPGAPSMLHTHGKVYKTTDAGLNWTLIWEGDNLARYIWVDPRNTQRLYVSTGIFDRGAANCDTISTLYGGVGILRSEDGGQSWTKLNETNGLDGLFIPSLFMHPTNPDVLFAAATSEGCLPGTGGGYVTRNGGETWQHILPEPFTEAVEIATSDTDVWYVAGSDHIWRSDDAGRSWQLFDMVTPDRDAGFPIDLQVDPRDPYRIFVNNYKGGNMLSTDGGETWVDASQGYTGAQVGDLTVAPYASEEVYALGSSGPFYSHDGGKSWEGRKHTPGWIFFRQWDSATEILRAGDCGSGWIYRSTDGGSTWDSTLVVNIPTGEALCPKALAIAPSDPQILYVGFAFAGCLNWDFPDCTKNVSPGFFRSSDGGHTWKHVAGTPFDNYSILSLAVSLDDPSTVFAATMNGPFVTRDRGETWQFLEDLDNMAGGSPPQPGVVVPSIWVMTIDPFNPQLIYAGSPRAAVFRSSDGGQTWEQAAAGMPPNLQVMDLIPDTERTGILYTALRYSGVFVSTDWAQTWREINVGLDRPEVHGLALSADGTVLYAGTNGAGVFRLGIPRQNVEVDIKPQSCPNPLNIKSKGVLPVAILGTANFDVSDIDVSSVKLVGVVPLRSDEKDVATPFDGELCDCTKKGPDGFEDLTLKFDKKTIVDALGEVNKGDEVELNLTGELRDGTPIEGTDCVVITPVGRGPQSAELGSSTPTFSLFQTYPNPIRSETTIRFSLPKKTHATLKIYDLTGRTVAILVDGELTAGTHTVEWKSDVASGIYFYRLTSRIGQADNKTLTRKMVLLK
jgi:photosystem II stability/assembly factor-like uncharacterized protein